MICFKNFAPFSSLKETEFSILENLTNKKQYRKGDTILKEGQVAENIIFLNSGIVSSVYTQKTKKFIRDFYFPPHIFTEQESFEKQIPAKFSIICVTDISCHFMSKDNLENAYNRIPSLKGIANDLLFTGFVNISNRLESLLTLNPEKRYLKLLNENPKLLHEIPLKMIASYLGVTDVALSRIRSRISKHKVN